MLGEAHRRLERGTDVVVGFVETHERQHTADMITGLEVVPRRVIEYRGARFEEMDLDAVLARHPQVALVDELAHTNVPGSRNAKRWQDIDELLDAGIDVISTVNIQHLESLNDVVRVDHRDQAARDRARRGRPCGGPARARRHEPGGAAPPPRPRQRLQAREGRRGPRQLLPRRQPHGAARARAAVARRPRRGGPREVPRRARHPGHVGGAHPDRRGPHRRTRGRDAAATRRPDLRAQRGPGPGRGPRRPRRRHRRRATGRRSRGCASSPRTSAAPSTRSSARTSPRPSSTSPARSTARRSWSEPPGAAGSAPPCGPAPPTTSCATPGTSTSTWCPTSGPAGRRPGDRRPRRVRNRHVWAWILVLVIPIGLALALVPFQRRR